MNTYSIPKPTLPAAAYLLGAALLIGLLGLGLVAYSVFLLVDNWIVAACFALVIELGAVSEAVGIIRKNRPAIAGAVISLLVSGSYNLTRIESAGLQLAGLHAWALAIGPLSAVLFLALSLSRELSEHEKRAQAWEKARQQWQDAQALQAEQARKEDQERARLARLEEKRIEGERLEREHLAEIEARERQERRAARLERSRIQQEQARNVPENRERTGANVPPAVPPTKGTYQDYLLFMASNGANHTRAELAGRFNVTERCITKWAARYREEHPTPAMELN